MSLKKSLIKRKYCSGQSLIETLIITVFFITMGFATLQLIVLAITHMTCNEATFSAARVAMVSNRDVNTNIRISLTYALFGQFPNGQLIPSVSNPPSAKPVSVEGLGQNDIQIKDVTFNYFVKVMFSSLFNSLGLNTGFTNGTSNVRTVISPGADYYDKAYPGAGRFKEG